jgi:hypothetical protein
VAINNNEIRRLNAPFYFLIPGRTFLRNCRLSALVVAPVWALRRAAYLPTDWGEVGRDAGDLEFGVGLL